MWSKPQSSTPTVAVFEGFETSDTVDDIMRAVNVARWFITECFDEDSAQRVLHDIQCSKADKWRVDATAIRHIELNSLELCQYSPVTRFTGKTFEIVGWRVYVNGFEYRSCYKSVIDHDGDAIFALNPDNKEPGDPSDDASTAWCFVD